MKPKKSQITIFIILGLMLVIIIAIFFIIKKPPEPQIIDEENPQAFIDSCTKQAVEEALVLLGEQGGDTNPKGSIKYKNKEITYLCYNENFYDPCINQRPLLIKHVISEITNYITPRVENCFQTLEKSLEKRYEISMGNMDIETNLQTNLVKIKVTRDFQMTREDNTRNFNEFEVNIIHPIYDLAEIANEIASQEAEFCNFNTDGFNSNYPKFKTRKEMIENTKIYIVSKRDSNVDFTFAIRSCVMPPGL